MGAWKNVALLTKAKSLEGGLSVCATEGLPFLLVEGMEVTFVPPVLKLPRSSRITQLDHKGGSTYLVYFADITSMTDAEKLVGHYCLVRKEDLPEGWDQQSGSAFAGVVVFDFAEGQLGSVTRVEENPAHPLLVVDYQGRNVLIPLVDDFIVNFDEEAATLTLDLPQGLLDQ